MRTSPRLRLHRQTLRELSSGELRVVAGQGTISCFVNPCLTPVQQVRDSLKYCNYTTDVPSYYCTPAI